MTFQARSLYTLQFCRISMKPVPRCAAARLSISSMCWMLRSTVRATNVAPQPSAYASGFTGRSAEPIGVAGHHEHFEIRARHAKPGGDRRSAAVDRMAAIGVHVVREPARAADAGD